MQNLGHDIMPPSSQMILGTHTVATPNVIIDGYTNSRSILGYAATLPLGTTVVLVCRVSGIPHGVQTNYDWTCPNGPCQQTGYVGRIINNNMLTINITSTRDGGKYVCHVTAEGRYASEQFQLSITGQFLHNVININTLLHIFSAFHSWSFCKYIYIMLLYY